MQQERLLVTLGYSHFNESHQGLVLGPLLFICYVNDMPDKIKSILKLYVDNAERFIL